MAALAGISKGEQFADGDWGVDYSIQVLWSEKVKNRSIGSLCSVRPFLVVCRSNPGVPNAFSKSV